MKPRIGNVMLGTMLVILLTTGAGKADTWITLDFPGAVHTSAHGIDGDLIVGAYSDASSTHGFVYDGSTWTTLDFPGAILTEPSGIDNGLIVGGYIDASSQQHGFMYDGVNWTTADYPIGKNRWAAGIDGDNIVGQYTTDTRHGFLYDGTSWTTLDFPGAGQTELRDIQGSNIVGTYNFYRGCLYNINDKTWTMLDFPGVSRTEPYGIDGDGNIVGTYSNIHGFLYDGTTWTTLDFPGASITDLFGIDGGRIVGRYQDASGWHGLVYTATIEAVIDIKPDTLDLSSKDKWVTCYIIPADDYLASDICVDSILLEGLLAVQHSDLQNGVLMVKFDRQELISYIRDVLSIVPPVPAVRLTVTGEFGDGACFEGIDGIRVIDDKK